MRIVFDLDEVVRTRDEAVGRLIFEKQHILRESTLVGLVLVTGLDAKSPFLLRL